MTRPGCLGSGNVEHTNRPIIHFGSPPGTTYTPVTDDKDT